MLYKVSSNFKGSLICKHFKRVLYANSKIDISEELFWENDVINLIRREILIPVDFDENTVNTKQNTISNSTVMVLESPVPINDNKEFKPVIWDFQKQELEKAQRIETTPPPINIDNKNDINEEKDVEFVIEPQKIDKTDTINEDKKEEMPPKKRNSKKNKDGIQPVGNIKTELTQADAAIELDSRGNPINTVFDNLVKGRGFTDGEEIDFLNG